MSGIVNNIIKDSNEANELKKLLFKNDNIKFKLLYQATKNGDKISDIENSVYNCSPTLFLVYTKKGIKCGGFTNAFWKSDSNYKIDNKAFLFNLTNKKIFHIKNPNQAIIMSSNHICFGESGHSDFYIRNKFLESKIYEAKSKIAYISENYDLTGENNSEINELEIYSVIFN